MIKWYRDTHPTNKNVGWITAYENGKEIYRETFTP